MSEALIISNLLLWLVVLGLLVLVFALTRQIGVLHERVAPVGALLSSEGPAVGEPAPVVDVEDWSANRLRVGGPDASGASTLLLFVSPSCPVCKVLLPVARSLRDAEPDTLKLVVASDGPRPEHERFVRSHDLEQETYVLSTELGLAHQVGQLPTAVLIDSEGLVRAKGLVNSREHLESLFEARDRGVASVQEYLARREEGQRVA